MVYYLNRKWKLLIFGSGVASCVLGLFMAVGPFIIPDSEDSVWLPIIIGLAFLLMGAEQFFEGSKTKIELSEDGIIYYQSRYIFSARWVNLQNIVPSPGTLVLQFSDVRLIRGGIAYQFVKALRMHRALAINYYLNQENREFIKNRIVKAKGISDPAEINSLEQVLG